MTANHCGNQNFWVLQLNQFDILHFHLRLRVPLSDEADFSGGISILYLNCVQVYAQIFHLFLDSFFAFLSWFLCSNENTARWLNPQIFFLNDSWKIYSPRSTRQNNNPKRAPAKRNVEVYGYKHVFKYNLSRKLPSVAFWVVLWLFPGISQK